MMRMNSFAGFDRAADRRVDWDAARCFSPDAGR
jgi:hypothetical protein